MKENGSKINIMEKEFIIFKMGQNMMENRKIINQMDMEFFNIQMEIDMKVIIKTM